MAYAESTEIQHLIRLLESGSKSTLAVGRNCVWLNGGGSDQFDHTEIIFSAKDMFGLVRDERYFLSGSDRLAFLTLCLDLYAEAGYAGRS